MKPLLLTKYNDEVVPALKEQFGYKNIHQVPVIEKIVINWGVGKAESDRKQAVQDALDAIFLSQGREVFQLLPKIVSLISSFVLGN